LVQKVLDRTNSPGNTNRVDFLFKADTATEALQRFLRMSSDDSATAGNRPALEITYTTPPKGTAILLK
jgi:hypothetical protein